MKKLYIFILLAYCTQQVFSQAGKLDTNFNSTGKAIISSFGLNYITNGVAIQSDGKILVASNAHSYYTGAGYPPGLSVTRLSGQGYADLSLGEGGTRVAFFKNSPVLSPVSVATEPDGKIVEAGSSQNKILIARYKKDGDLDKTFGSKKNGEVITNFGSGLNLTVTSLAIQADGKIVIGGYIISENGNDFFVTRYTINGIPDKTFGTNGTTILPYTGDEKATSIAIQKDGKIVEAGYANNNTGNIDFAIARFNTNGTVDLSFGYLLTIGLGGDDYGESVAIQPNGKIVIAGYSEKNDDADVALVRYNTNGTLDNTFAGNGKLVRGFGNKEYIKSVAIQKNGKILVGGHSFLNGMEAFLLTRFKNDGSLDSSFSNNGRTMTTFTHFIRGAMPSFGRSLAIQTDGKIVFTGYSYAYDFDTGSDLYYISTARYLSDGNNFSIPGVDEIRKESSIYVASIQQNFPNPFTNATTINYSLPDKFSSAQIIITDKNGRQLKQLNLSSGKGSVHIDASTLAAGAFNYSLYVNGKLVETKQMEHIK